MAAGLVWRGAASVRPLSDVATRQRPFDRRPVTTLVYAPVSGSPETRVDGGPRLTVESGATVKIATWNLSHGVKRGAVSRASGWAHLRSLEADVALVQEAGIPTPSASSVVAEDPTGRGWGTAVVSDRLVVRPLDGPIRPAWNRQVVFRIPDAARPGSLAVGLVDPGDGIDIVAISLYGMLRYADQSILRAASDILPIFDTPLRRRVIIGGDWNIHTHSNDPGERARAGPILAVLEAFGLRDLVAQAYRSGTLLQGPQAHLDTCPCGIDRCTHVRTHRHSGHTAGAMANNDYLFATAELADRLDSILVMNGDDDAVWTHSDHAPIIAWFGL